jgi:hypothetical protein
LSAGGSPTVVAYTFDSSIGHGTATLNNANTFGDTQISFYVQGNTDSPTTVNRIIVIQTTSATPQAGALEE